MIEQAADKGKCTLFLDGECDQKRCLHFEPTTLAVNRGARIQELTDASLGDQSLNHSHSQHIQ
jgi:hypothetical protein